MYDLRDACGRAVSLPAVDAYCQSRRLQPVLRANETAAPALSVQNLRLRRVCLFSVIRHRGRRDTEKNQALKSNIIGLGEHGLRSAAGAATNQMSWLQRSQMFIDTAEPRCPRSSGAQCPATLGERGLHFAPLERDPFGDRAFYKHFVPRGRGRLLHKTCSEKQKLIVCFAE